MTARASLAWALVLGVPLAIHPHPAATVLGAVVVAPFVLLALERWRTYARGRRDLRRTLAAIDRNARKDTGGPLGWS